MPFQAKIPSVQDVPGKGSLEAGYDDNDSVGSAASLITKVWLLVL